MEWLHEGNYLNKQLKRYNFFSHLVDQCSLERRGKICDETSEIPERKEIVNWNDMKDVFWTALATSDVDKHKYGSYPDQWNDKSPLIMIKEPYDFFFFFFMLVVWKHLTNVNQASSVFFFFSLKTNKNNYDLAVLLHVILSANSSHGTTVHLWTHKLVILHLKGHLLSQLDVSL